MGKLNARPPSWPEDGSFKGWNFDSRMPGHWLVALMAALLSVLVHAGVAWMASRVDFSFLQQTGWEKPQRRFEALAVDRVDLAADKAPEMLEALRVLDGLGIGASADLAQAIETHQMPPDAAAIEPPALQTPVVEPDLDLLSGAELPPLDVQWQPRQEIVAIETKAVMDTDRVLPRREIPAIERVIAAPDVVLPIDVSDIPAESESTTALVVPSATRIDGGAASLAPSAIRDAGPTALDQLTSNAPGRLEERPDEITDAAPIERVLRASVETFLRSGETHGYFRLTIERAGAELLPVMPKDVLFVQDTSATIAEQRLHFSRRGFREGLASIGAQDRFNLATFVDNTTYAFPKWEFRSAETDATAQQFLADMRVEGNTDFLGSMQQILQFPRDPDRPVIAIVVTDGLMHSGITDSTEIIARFTRENQGAVSIFTLGVADYANHYLLDMLSHFNGGEARYIRAGRWDIPDDLIALIQSVQRPVLGGLRVRFGQGADIEGYPLAPGNLYLDRPLVIYGRYARETDRLVFFAAGRSGPQQSDMVFDLPLPAAIEGKGDASIRDGWSQQKMYDLIARYTQTRDRQYLREMASIARRYNQRVPFRTIFGL